MTTPAVRNDPSMRYDGRVVAVTGAGNGLGRAYALGFAARGASVVVNDLGVSVDGSSTSSGPSLAVVEEITGAGGQAVPSPADVTSVEGGQQIVKLAIDTFGRLDVLVNNAGVVDTGQFLTTPDATVRRVIDTHLLGAFNVTRPALTAMLDAGYGRIINTSSGAVFGSQEGVAYQSAKSGLIAFTRAISQIGSSAGVTCNAILPTAFTRLTSGITDVGFRNFMEQRFSPERVAAAVLMLAHESVTTSGECFLAGGGRLARLFLGVSAGYVTDDPTPEEFRQHLRDVLEAQEFTVPASRIEEFQSYLPSLGYGADLSSSLVGNGR